MAPDRYATPVLSAKSVARLNRLSRGVQTIRPANTGALWRVGLLHPRQGFGLREVGPSGTLDESASSEFHLLVVDRTLEPGCGDIDFKILKTRLAPGGAILLHRRKSAPLWLRPWFRATPRRRKDDRRGPEFGGGADRAEQGLRQSGLYVSEFYDRHGKERWLVASAQPFHDARYRDHIGRVSRDFLKWSIGWTLLPDLPGVTAFESA